MFTVEADNTEFGKGFSKQMNVQFLPFLAVLQNFENIVLKKDDKALTVISKREFIDAAGRYSTPAVDGQEFYNSFPLFYQRYYHNRHPLDQYPVNKRKTMVIMILYS